MGICKVCNGAIFAANEVTGYAGPICAKGGDHGVSAPSVFLGSPLPSERTAAKPLASPKVTPDTSLRAAIAKITSEICCEPTTCKPDKLCTDCVKDSQRLYDLFKSQLTAERTAIKAALPEKRDEGFGEVKPGMEDMYIHNKGFNWAIDKVTQVIDGRE